MVLLLQRRRTLARFVDAPTLDAVLASEDRQRSQCTANDEAEVAYAATFSKGRAPRARAT